MILKLKKELTPALLIIIFITLFIFIISFTAFYTQENFSAVCGCKLPIWVIIISISSFGIFTGSLLYYLINKEELKEQKDVKNLINKLLELVEGDEKKVLEFIIDNSGKIYQSQISKKLNLNKVKASRIINHLEEKRIIIKEKQGMTNLIKLDEEITKIFKK